MVITSITPREPLQGGDVIRHEIQLSNTTSETRPCTKISPFVAGDAMTFGDLIDDGGGAFRTDLSSWVGTLAPDEVKTLSEPIAG